MSYVNEVFLGDQLDPDELPACVRPSGGGRSEDVWGWITALQIRSVGHLLAQAPATWLPISDALSSIPEGPRLAHACLEKAFAQDQTNRDGYSPPALYAGTSSSLTREELLGIPGYLDTLKTHSHYESTHYQAPPPMLQPAAFTFHADPDGSWEHMVDSGRERGWEEESVPHFSGLAVVQWIAHANRSSRRLRLERVELSLIHHIEADLRQPLLVPIYAELKPWQSVLRAETISRLLAHIDWPPEMRATDVSDAMTAVAILHRPWHPASEYDPEALSVNARTLVEVLEPYLPVPRDEGAASIDPSGSGPFQLRLPEPRLVKTALAAELYAAEIIAALGFRDVNVTPPGADGGVDVRSDEAVVQVKMEGVSTGRPVVQALFGVAMLEQRKGVIFSLAGYTSAAIAWAERAEVALFEFEFDGTVTARSSLGAELLRVGVTALTT